METEKVYPSVSGISIRGVDRASLIAALHNGTQPLGMGQLHARGDMTPHEVERELGILQGETLLGEWAYDRDAGDGACRRVIERVKAQAKEKADDSRT